MIDKFVLYRCFSYKSGGFAEQSLAGLTGGVGTGVRTAGLTGGVGTIDGF